MTGPTLPEVVASLLAEVDATHQAKGEPSPAWAETLRAALDRAQQADEGGRRGD